MGNIGISIYPAKSTFEHDKEYLDLARKYGFKRIFTSLLEIEGDADEIINKFKKIIEYGNSIGMETILDINPGLFKQLNISYDNLGFFKQIGAYGIRLDLGFTGLEEAQMTKNPYDLKIEVNMSSGTKYIENILSYHPKKRIYTLHITFIRNGIQVFHSHTLKKRQPFLINTISILLLLLPHNRVNSVRGRYKLVYVHWNNTVNCLFKLKLLIIG